MKTEHTPGPWFIDDESQAGYKPTIVNKAAKHGTAEDHIYICDVRGPGRDWKTPSKKTEANAHLIAAAPEMLEALKLVDPVIKEIFKEQGQAFRKGAKGATQWGIVNDGLVKVAKAIAQAQGDPKP